MTVAELRARVGRIVDGVSGPDGTIGRNSFLAESRANLAVGEGLERFENDARDTIRNLDQKIALVRETGKPVLVYTTFVKEKMSPLTLEEVVKDPLAQEIWRRLCADSSIGRAFKADKVWSDSNEFPIDPHTGPALEFENTFVERARIYIKPK